MARHQVLVTAVGGNVGQGIVKSLNAGARQYRVIGVDMDPLSCGFPMVDGFYAVSRTGSAAFRREIEKILIDEKIEAVFASSATDLAFFSGHKRELESASGATILVNPPHVVDIGGDKMKTARFMRDAGFNYIETAAAADADAVDALVAECGFPLLAKPRVGHGSRHVHVLNTRDDLACAAALTPDLVVQRYVGEARQEFTAGTVSGRDGRVKEAIVLRRDLTQGTTARTELCRDAAVAGRIVEITEKLGAVGPCNTQFRLVDGDVWVFDINPRFSGTSGIRYLYGLNDVELCFELLRLGICDQPPAVLQDQLVMRYWNEIVVPGGDFDTPLKSKLDECRRVDVPLPHAPQ